MKNTLYDFENSRIHYFSVKVRNWHFVKINNCTLNEQTRYILMVTTAIIGKGDKVEIFEKIYSVICSKKIWSGLFF